MIVKMTMIGLLLSLTAVGEAHAQSASAYDSAACHASFLSYCVDSTVQPSEAPLPMMGASSVALGMMSLVALIRRHKTKKTNRRPER